MTTQSLIIGILVVVLVGAVGHDLATRRIPNWLVVSALLAGAALNAQAGGMAGGFAGAWVGFGKSLLGALTGLAIMLPLYGMRAMGAGDVKLMAGVGALLGPMQALGSGLLAFLAGGVLALIAMLRSGESKRVGDNLRLIAITIALPGRSRTADKVETTGRLPYALAIAAGTALQIWLATQAGWPFR